MGNATQRVTEPDARIQLRFEKFSAFVEEYWPKISLGGMFLKTTDLKPVGTVLSFQFDLTDGFQLCQGVGEVAWVRRRDQGPDQPVGMGIRFRALDEQGRELIVKILEEQVKSGRVPFDVEKIPPGVAATRGPMEAPAASGLAGPARPPAPAAADLSPEPEGSEDYFETPWEKLPEIPVEVLDSFDDSAAAPPASDPEVDLEQAAFERDALDFDLEPGAAAAVPPKEAGGRVARPEFSFDFDETTLELESPEFPESPEPQPAVPEVSEGAAIPFPGYQPAAESKAEIDFDFDARSTAAADLLPAEEAPLLAPEPPPAPDVDFDFDPEATARADLLPEGDTAVLPPGGFDSGALGPGPATTAAAESDFEFAPAAADLLTDLPLPEPSLPAPAVGDLEPAGADDLVPDQPPAAEVPLIAAPAAPPAPGEGIFDLAPPPRESPVAAPPGLDLSPPSPVATPAPVATSSFLDADLTGSASATGWEGEEESEWDAEDASGPRLFFRDLWLTLVESWVRIAVVVVLVAVGAASFVYREEILERVGMGEPPIEDVTRAPQAATVDDPTAEDAAAGEVPGEDAATAAPEPDLGRDTGPEVVVPEPLEPAVAPSQAAARQPPPERPTTGPPSGAVARRVTTITFRQNGGETVVVIHFDGQLAAGRYEHSDLAYDPTKEQLTLLGIEAPFPSPIPVGTSELRQIRTGFHPGNRLHVVFDFVARGPAIAEVRNRGDRLEVSIRR